MKKPRYGVTERGKKGQRKKFYIKKKGKRRRKSSKARRESYSRIVQGGKNMKSMWGNGGLQKGGDIRSSE